ncbi:unnamed protein product [Pleuronectes platessa]|uniref:Uncharacterized protein n=1 Tax=Pleuronectes platessa TaxID=8262 RepID=A0A9N7VFV8_PLEPL|nr:unnamed protein product [Pleuronectes platessa]
MLKDTVDFRQRNWFPELDLTWVKGKSAHSSPSALQTADPETSSGQTGCRLSQTKDTASGFAAQPELTVHEKPQLTVDKRGGKRPRAAAKEKRERLLSLPSC